MSPISDSLLQKVWCVSHKSNVLYLFVLHRIEHFWTNYCLMTVRQFICIMLFYDVGSAWLTSTGCNVRELAQRSQPQGFGSHSGWWTEDDLWEHHMQSRWSSTNPSIFMWIFGASLRSQNPSLPPTSFQIGNRWYAGGKEEWSTQKQMSYTVMMNPQMNDSNCWMMHPHDIIITHS